jgi:N-acetylglucosaminyldiphosphoundecaprenol N-acetyl-beta-D-mannosaminyltransferase
MIDSGKNSVLGIMINSIDYDAAIQKINAASVEGRSCLVTALAVHGIITGVQSSEHKYRLNSFDLVVPDGQPVRWALNLLHGAKLRERVYGPELTLRLLRHAEERKLPVFFYGSTPTILNALTRNLRFRFRKLIIAGSEPSKFRTLSEEERLNVASRIVGSGARMTFVGLGCPRQEVFAYEMRDILPMPVIAVGAAFPFIAGQLPQAPPALQRWGLEWLYRLRNEPRRLWRRYLLLNPLYLMLLGAQVLGRTFPTDGQRPPDRLLFG